MLNLTGKKVLVVFQLLSGLMFNTTPLSNLKNEALPLARKALSYYLERGETIRAAKSATEILSQARPLFITLTKNGKARGCAGTFEPTDINLAEEIIRFVIVAATQDFRYPPVSPPEVDQIFITITLPEKPVPITSLSSYNPWTEGLLIQKSGLQGIVLPSEAKTTAYAIKIALRNSGLDKLEGASLYKFTAVNVTEGDKNEKNNP